VHTRTTFPEFTKREMSAVREHEEFVWLHNCLEDCEDYAGFIVSYFIKYKFKQILLLIRVNKNFFIKKYKNYFSQMGDHLLFQNLGHVFESAPRKIIFFWFNYHFFEFSTNRPKNTLQNVTLDLNRWT
jgi:hypothetical protein